MFFDGPVRLSWLDVSNNGTDVGVGISAGPGVVPDDYYEYDFSNMGNYCSGQVPVAEDSAISLWAGESEVLTLSAEYAQGYMLVSLPAEGVLYNGQQAITSVPYDLADTGNFIVCC